ncbi:MAG: hypothetical protein OK438_04555 [Thaumarchaeota archaeon]|nr:hypothetical protein [Nitrososphaerota archaeon]
MVVLVLAAAAIIVIVSERQGTPLGTPSLSTGSSTTKSSSQGLSSPKGVSFSPASLDQSGMNDFFSKAQQAGGLVEWAGDWRELGNSGAPSVIAQLAAQHNLRTMIVVQFFSQTTGQLLRPLNTSNEQNYTTDAVRFAQEYKPAYFGIGIEVNMLYEKNLTSFQQFVSLYGSVYDQVKEASPDTKVFTVFQFEKLNGLNGGLYGGTNDLSKAEWQLLQLFPKDDVAAFTTYPGLVYHSPSEIPADYYARIASHTNMSIGFTEVGWHSGNLTGGWGSNEVEQASFVTTFFNLSSGLHKAFVVWSFLYDQKATVPFNTMGFFYVNGTAKQAWQKWVEG